MSLGDTGSIGNCADGGLREAICTSVAAGITYVAAAGNSSVDASTFIPAAFPEVIAVSAMADLDGEPGGLGGCQFILDLLPTSATTRSPYFSNYGSLVDVTAPGVQVYSTWTGGGYQSESGTSMASPHVAGVAALVKAANPSLTPAQVEQLLKSRREPQRHDRRPDRLRTRRRARGRAIRTASASRWSTPRAPRRWPQTGGAERPTEHIGHLPRRRRVRSAARPPSPPLPRAPNCDHERPVLGRRALPSSTDTTAPYIGRLGHHARPSTASTRLSVKATDSTGAYACASSTRPSRDQPPGQLGRQLRRRRLRAGLAGTAPPTTSSPCRLASVTLEQGSRWQWSTTDDRRARAAAADRLDPPRDHLVRRHPAQLRAQLHGGLQRHAHLYAVDWEGTTRRQNVTVNDGTTTGRSASRPTSTPAPGCTSRSASRPAARSSSRVDRDGRHQQPSSRGLFLGGGGTPPPAPPAPPPPYEQGVQGTWDNIYGVDGYALGGWNNATSDLVSCPGAYGHASCRAAAASWSQSTTDVRALQTPGGTARRATAWYDANQLRCGSTFTSAYTGTLHLYAVDWEATARRQNVTVDDGSDPRRSTSRPTSTPAPGCTSRSASRPAARSTSRSIGRRPTAPSSRGLFLGGAGTPPARAATGSARTASTATTWAAGTGRTATSSAMPNATVTCSRASATLGVHDNDARALAPTGRYRRAATWYDTAQLRLRVDFSTAYSGTLHLYAVDWENAARRQNITVNDGTTTRRRT